LEFPLGWRVVSRIKKLSAASAACLAAAVGLAACGGIPGDALVSVGGTPITKTAFNHWMEVAAQGASPTTNKEKVPVPEPPEYKTCIAHQESAAAIAAKGKATSNPALYKSQCEQQYKAYVQEVLDFLISAQWVLSEASEQGISASESEIKKQFETLKKEEFQKESAYESFLSHTGETEADLLARVKLQVLARKIQEKVTKDAKKKPDKQEIEKYFKEHETQYGHPERRNVNLILTKAESAASSAKAEIEGGKSFASVSKAVSIDPVTKNNGGVLNEVVKGEEEKSLSEAIFAASTGKLLGPIKTPFGYYIFEVTKVLPAVKEPLSKVESTIAATITSTSSTRALSKFVEEFKKKWQSRTECRQGYVVPDCASYKAATKSSTGATG
jgi:foldase protein PrsA